MQNWEKTNAVYLFYFLLYVIATGVAVDGLTLPWACVLSQGQDEPGGGVWTGYPAGGSAATLGPVGCTGAPAVLQLCQTGRSVGLLCSPVGHAAFIHLQIDVREAPDCTLEVCSAPVPDFTYGGDLPGPPGGSFQA